MFREKIAKDQILKKIEDIVLANEQFEIGVYRIGADAFRPGIWDTETVEVNNQKLCRVDAGVIYKMTFLNTPKDWNLNIIFERAPWIFGNKWQMTLIRLVVKNLDFGIKLSDFSWTTRRKFCKVFRDHVINDEDYRKFIKAKALEDACHNL